MAYEMAGNVVHVGETEVFGSGFQKRILVIEKADGAYTNQYGAVFTKDNVDKLDSVNVGDEVTVHTFENTLGKVREYNGKWYSDMPTGFKVDVGASAPDAPPALEDDGEFDVPF